MLNWKVLSEKNNMYNLEDFTLFLEQQVGIPTNSLSSDYIALCYQLSLDNQQNFLNFVPPTTQSLLVYLYGVHIAIFLAYTDTSNIGMAKLQEIQTNSNINAPAGILSSTNNGASSVSMDIPDFAKNMSSYGLSQTKWGLQWLSMSVAWRMLGAIA